MLIDTGQKENFLSLEPVVARNDIGQHLFVGMTDMRRRIRVIDRRRNEKGLWHFARQTAGRRPPAQLPPILTTQERHPGVGNLGASLG